MTGVVVVCVIAAITLPGVEFDITILGGDVSSPAVSVEDKFGLE